MGTALITGASSGIGKTFADELAKRKMDLVLVARSEEDLNKIAKNLQDQYKIKADVIAHDLTETDAAKAVLDEVNQKGITIDLLVNAAGFGDYGAFAERDRIKQLEMVQLNILALVDLTYQFLPGMRDRSAGSIINISSTAAFQPIPYFAVYAATKAFVLSFTESLWAENKDSGVRILAVCPGPTKTEFFEEAEFPEEMKNLITKASSSPEEVVSEALKALEGDRSTVVPGTANQVMVNLPRFLPREALVSMVESQFKIGEKEKAGD